MGILYLCCRVHAPLNCPDNRDGINENGRSMKVLFESNIVIDFLFDCFLIVAE